MNKKQFIELIGKDVEIDYLFGKEVQQWNMKNFYIDENGEIKHKRLSLIMDKFISRCVYPSIVDLIEKATPKKVNRVKTKSYDTYEVKIYGYCPVCDSDVFFDYCPHCGQRIDWSEEDVI